MNKIIKLFTIEKNIIKEPHYAFLIALMIWFVPISMIFCLFDKETTFFIMWEEFLNVCGAVTIYLALKRKDNSNIVYITSCFLQFLWMSFATVKDSTDHYYAFWQQSLYVFVDVAMALFLFSMFILGLILLGAKIAKKGFIDNYTLRMCSYWYGG